MKKMEYFNENREKLDLLDKFIEENQLGLIPILRETQRIFGSLNEYNIAYISDKIKLSTSRIYGVASYYSEFRFEDRAECIIEICNGTGCFLKGSNEILKAAENLLNLQEGEKSIDGKIELKTVSCLGYCSDAPVVRINNKIYGNMSREKMEELLNKYL